MAYTYEPIPEDCHTRVLELYPALDPKTPLRGTFRYVNLDIGPFYDAISYTWGEPHFTEEIVIGESFRLRITPNLCDALIRYRLPTEVRSIWADAICIDQANDEDKRKQIPLMTDIYRCASSVLVWIGNHPLAEACLGKVSLLSQRKTIANTSDRDEISSALTQLVSLPWFSRRWVIQEIVVNPNVIFFCGTISLPWLRVARLTKVFRKEELPPPILHLNALREVWDIHNHSIPDRAKGGTITILNLLSTFAEADCSDPRDRIYALLGLASDVVFEDYKTRRNESKILVRIDYTQSVKQVYHDFALAIKESESVDDKQRLLFEAARRFDGSPMGEWDLWVPDWRLPIVRPRLSIADIKSAPIILSNSIMRRFFRMK